MTKTPKVRNWLAASLRSPSSPFKPSTRKDKRKQSRGKLKLDLKRMASEARKGRAWLGLVWRW